MRSKTRLKSVVAGAALLIGGIVAADAHPHVFAEARLEIAIDGASRVSYLRHLWRFDDVFSSTVLMEFDTNSDLVLDEKELDNAAATIKGSLAEYNYFQLVTSNGRDVAMIPPARLVAKYESDQLVVLFETQPRKALGLSGKVAIGVYDPTFYTAIDFTSDDKIAVANLPQGCERTVVRPDPNDAIAQNQGTLTDAFFNDPTGTNLGKIFATRLELTCPAK